jgi:hypothetical protein
VENLRYWSTILPVAFDGTIELGAPSTYHGTTTIGSSFALRAAMTRLADLVELPSSVPRRSGSFEIGDWFTDGEAGEVEAPPGRWRDDLDSAVYIAILLRGAEFSINRHCPIRYADQRPLWTT